MNAFRTELNAGVSNYTFDVSDKIITVGSCFSDAIGTRLLQHKVDTSVNPFGAIYNPISIHKLIHYALSGQVPDEDSYLHQRGIFFNYGFHSRFAASEKNSLSEQIKTALDDLKRSLTKSAVLIITYGTSWVYERMDTNAIVANCHKAPAKHFRKSLLSQKQILNSFDEMYKMLRKVNQDLHIILTVSPVRHIKDSLELNGVSKAMLRVACHTLAGTYDKVEYFPAYEIMMDDLRDYRFYKRDMIHPTEEAEDYIWEMFLKKYGSQRLKSFIKQWKKILNALDHKPFHPRSLEHQRFLKDTLRELEELKAFTNVDKEIEQIKSQLLS